MGAQIAIALIGVWLLVSAFLWQHSIFQFHNAVACGVASIALAIAGMCYREAVFLGSLLSMWLLLSAIFVPSVGEATYWNNILVAIAIWGNSIAGGCREPS